MALSQEARLRPPVGGHFPGAVSECYVTVTVKITITKVPIQSMLKLGVPEGNLAGFVVCVF